MDGQRWSPAGRVGSGSRSRACSVREGYRLTVSARRPEKLEQAVERAAWRRARRAARCRRTWSSEDEHQGARPSAHRERFGRLDVLVNNAGIGIGGPIADHETKRLDMELGVNLRATYLTLRECIPMLKRGRRGAPQGARRQRRLDRRSPRRGVARGILGDEGRHRRPEPGGARRARRRRHPGYRVLPGVRRHADDRLGAGRPARGDDST